MGLNVATTGSRLGRPRGRPRSERCRLAVRGAVIDLMDELPYSAITVGLPFQCQLQSLYLDIQSPDGTIQSKRKTIPAVTVRMQDSRGIKAGPNFQSLVEIKERTTEAMGQPIRLFTGDQRVVLPATYNVPGQICVQVDDPLPSTILALIPEVVIGDTP